jgi:SAM-dependent methyltransferase
MINPINLRSLVSKPVRGFIRFLSNKIPVKIDILRPKSKWPGEDDRFSYQTTYVNFDIKPTDRVLDIGSGGSPFPYATVLVDRFLEPSRHRYASLVREGKPLVVADSHRLPFRDKCFDFIYCSHLLEHVENPLRACAEIMRVGKQGFIETPTMGKDALFAWAKDMHKWHIVGCGQNLCFFEYSERQLQGIRSSAWSDIIFSKWRHPLQKVFYENQDLFNVLFSWKQEFQVFVFHLDGKVESFSSGVGDQHAFSNS